MNAWLEGNKACREAAEVCVEKVKAETDADRKKINPGEKRRRPIRRGRRQIQKKCSP
jgi:hypothetical protein